MWTPEPKRCTPADQQLLCDKYGVPLREQNTVLKVESSGLGYGLLPDGRPIILFERHHFYRHLPVSLRAATAAARPDICSPTAGGYATASGAQAKQLGYSVGLLRCYNEWRRLSDAMAIHREAALKSASWGLGQIMGSNFKYVGCQNVQQFINLNYANEESQVELQLRFICANPVLKRALLTHNWKVFAAGYNGKFYYKANPPYDVRLARAYASFA